MKKRKWKRFAYEMRDLANLHAGDATEAEAIANEAMSVGLERVLGLMALADMQAAQSDRLTAEMDRDHKRYLSSLQTLREKRDDEMATLREGNMLLGVRLDAALARVAELEAELKAAALERFHADNGELMSRLADGRGRD